MKVKDLRKVLTEAVAELETMPEDIEVFHVLRPDAPRLGSVFEWQVRHEIDEDGNHAAALYLYY